MITEIDLHVMSLEEQYQFMKNLIQWEPSVVSEHTQTFRISRIMKHTTLRRQDVIQMIANLKEHLEPIVDDNDFCNKIHWCFEKARKSDYSPARSQPRRTLGVRLGAY